jgi:multiple sugar transport system substrate-binding protein
LLSEAGITAIPTTIEELEAAATALAATDVDAPMCFAAEWQRAGAFIHAFGGGLTDEAGAPILDSAESQAGLDWYLSMYEQGLAAKAPDLGAGWCGEAFGRENVAIAFEGNWIGPAMEADFPEVAYTVSAIPAGPAGSATLAYTNAYGISPNADNLDASWALLTYLTGPEGMQEWVNGGLVLPSRSDVEPSNERQETYAAFVDTAFPGEGFTPRWPEVAAAFNPALDAQATSGYSADAVIQATLPILQEVTGQ